MRRTPISKAAMKPHRELIDTIFTEMKGRMKDDDSSVPQKRRRWLILDRVRRRRANTPNGTGGRSRVATMQVILERAGTCRPATIISGSAVTAVSPNARLLAYAIDTNGSERFVLKVRDLATGADLPDIIENWRYGIVWAADSKSFLYTDADENWRSKAVWHHRLGDPQSGGPRGLSRSDPGIRRHRSAARNRVALRADQQWRSRHQRNAPVCRLSDFPAEPVLVCPARRTDRIYDLDEREGTLYIRINDYAPEFPGGDGAGLRARYNGLKSSRVRIATTFSA